MKAISGSTIEKRKRISEEVFLTKFGFPNKPLLLEGYCKKWLAFKKWNNSFFIKKYGERKVTVFSCFDWQKQKEVTIKEYFKYLESPKDKHLFYLKNWVFEDDLPELLNDYNIPPFFNCWTNLLDKQMRPKYRWLYIGPKGSGSPLHLDVLNTSAWNCVITGKKVWNFYPPEQKDFLYDWKVNTFKPDLKKFPLFKHAKPLTCIQNPGDIVFTPTGWFHQVINVKAGISLTENFINETNCVNVLETLQKQNNPSSQEYITLLNEKIKTMNIIK